MEILKAIWSSINQKVYALSSSGDWMQTAYGVEVPERHIDGRLPLIIKIVLTLLFLLLGILLYNKKFSKKKKIVIFIILILALVVSIVLVDVIYNYLII